MKWDIAESRLLCDDVCGLRGNGDSEGMSGRAHQRVYDKVRKTQNLPVAAFFFRRVSNWLSQCDVTTSQIPPELSDRK